MMDLDSFIEWMEQADPASAQMVHDGYCSWEDLGYEPEGEPRYDADDEWPDDYEHERRWLERNQ